MSEGLDPALLVGYHRLPRGLCVGLRLARPRDAAAVADLFWTQGRDPDELEVTRLVRFDPRRRVVICATALIDSLETMVGVGEIDLRADRGAGPNLVLVDELRATGLEELLSDALTGRARLLGRDHAA